MRLANARSWSEIPWELTTEVVETNFEVDGVLIRLSKEDLVWFESCQVGELMCWVKPVEFSKSARSSSISLGEVPGKLSHQRSLDDLPHQCQEWQGVSQTPQEILTCLRKDDICSPAQCLETGGQC